MGKLRQKGSGGQIMLEKVDLTMKMEKSEYKAKMTALKLQMGKLQRQCKEMGLPIMIVFEGFDAAAGSKPANAGHGTAQTDGVSEKTK